MCLAAVSYPQTNEGNLANGETVFSVCIRATMVRA